MYKMAYSISEAKLALGLGRTTIYKMIKEGKLRPIKVGSKTLLRHDDLIDFLAENRQ